MQFEDNDLDARDATATLTEVVFNKLRSDILQCRLKPGSKLRQTELQNKYNASGSAIREALSRLMSLGLVTAESQRGFRVVETSAKDFIDLTKTRVLVEAMMIRAAISAGGREWEAGILAAEHMLGGEKQKFVLGYHSGSEEDARRARHLHFHDSLVAGCGMSNLMTLRATLTALTDRYRFLSVLVSPRRDVPGEHRVMSRAALNRDQEKAVLIIGVHFLTTAEDVLSEGARPTVAVAQALETLWSEICVAAALPHRPFASAKAMMWK
jgi:GntR family carbon starvation induced transcriptional regulator